MERKLKIITENCPQNHKCPAVNVCPVGALTQTNFEAPKIDYDNCQNQERRKSNIPIAIFKNRLYNRIGKP